MTELIARFSVTAWEPRALEDLDDSWAGAVGMSKTFTAGLVGGSAGLFLASGAEEGNRAYVAVERVTGTTDDGRTGSVTVHHGGLEADPETWFGHVVPGSGTGDFTGWAGSARIEHDDQGAYFRFTVA